MAESFAAEPRRSGRAPKPKMRFMPAEEPFVVPKWCLPVVTTRPKAKTKKTKASAKKGNRSGRKPPAKNKDGSKPPPSRWRRYRSGISSQLSIVRFNKTFLDAYTGGGWQGHAVEKPKPQAELDKAKAKVAKCKAKMRELMRELETEEQKDHRPIPKDLWGDDGLPSADIFCASCGGFEATASNDIILCDGDCHRAYHQQCLDPPMSSLPEGDDDEPWFCPQCSCEHACYRDINDEFGTDFQRWDQIFAEQDHKKKKDGKEEEEEEDDAGDGNSSSSNSSSSNAAVRGGGGGTLMDMAFSSDSGEEFDEDEAEEEEGEDEEEEEEEEEEGEEEKEEEDSGRRPRRKRARVNYQRLAAEMFGIDPSAGGGDPSSSSSSSSSPSMAAGGLYHDPTDDFDADFSPSAKKKKKKKTKKTTKNKTNEDGSDDADDSDDGSSESDESDESDGSESFDELCAMGSTQMMAAPEK